MFSARNTDCTTKRERLLGDAFIFYCCVTNSHKFGGLKQCPFIIVQFLWVRVQAQLNWVLCPGSHRLKSGVRWASFSYGVSTREGSALRLSSVVGRIHFLVAIHGCLPLQADNREGAALFSNFREGLDPL